MKLAGVVALLFAVSPGAHAGQEIAPPGKGVVETSPFDQGRHEFQVGVGGYFSLNKDAGERPTIDDVDLNLRLGWMLTSPAGSGICRGNFELLAEVFGAVVVDGPGDVIAGGTVLLRYNFVQPDAKLVPYFQLGVGGIYNDIYRDQNQRIMGQALEFNLQGGLGLRYLFNDHMACFAEADFRHLSNADTASRNVGLNSLGFQVGVSWFW